MLHNSPTFYSNQWIYMIIYHSMIEWRIYQLPTLSFVHLGGLFRFQCAYLLTRLSKCGEVEETPLVLGEHFWNLHRWKGPWQCWKRWSKRRSFQICKASWPGNRQWNPSVFAGLWGDSFDLDTLALSLPVAVVMSIQTCRPPDEAGWKSGLSLRLVPAIMTFLVPRCVAGLLIFNQRGCHLACWDLPRCANWGYNHCAGAKICPVTSLLYRVTAHAE